MSANTKFQKLLPIIAEAGEIILSAHKMEKNFIIHFATVKYCE